MAVAGGAAAAAAAVNVSTVIYHVRRMHFFAYDGFVVYTFECDNSDFNQLVLEAIEFSNQPWAE
jgi:hypothetical protein